ncbi:SDR family NAD(P)-dependent oxidoreductase [Fodinicurvata sp. EGI_FJ10296]|uniref:SDR family NAD(P)-dependent oxidoreductase n=1 Tax=Fodinicurvata sp. EGI_FJ10296 TaxID=3231908 RepID=UPI003451FC32
MPGTDFSGQIAVITGGAQGIGFAVAERIADAGGFVHLWDQDEELAKSAATELGTDKAAAHGLDISDHKAVDAATRAVVDQSSRIDVLINSAGITGPNATTWEYPVDAWQTVMAVNLNGTFLTCRAIVPHMREKGYGRIVNIASIAGKEGNPNAPAYSASKAGVIGLTKSLGKELADMDIGVNCVTPAAARTRIFDQMKQEHIDYMLSKIPRGRFLELNEASAMIVWMASRENSFTTGGVFDLSGGRATY